jgi:hypothetical protein
LTGGPAVDKSEHDRLARKMKRAKREAEDLEDEIAKESDTDRKRRMLSDLDDLQAKARRLKRKLK